MADNIYDGHFAHRGETPWHGLGSAIDDDSMNVSEACERYGFDYTVESIPLRFRSPSGIEVITDRVALVRPAKDEHLEEIFGYASDKYRVIQNAELSALLDPLTREWPLETMGALGRGETFFITLNAGLDKVGGDDIRQFFFVYNSHDGNSSLKINVTPIRVVCANTCATGLRQATITADIRHTQRVHREAEFAINLVAQLKVHRAEVLEGLDALTRIHVNADQISRIVEAVYPESTTPSRLAQLEAHERGDIVLPDDVLERLVGAKNDHESERLRVQKLRLAAWNGLMRFNEERPDYAFTGWAVYNAVTELASHRDGGTDAQRARSILLGERQKEMATAYRELVKLA